jgi:hypothetical protein
MIFRGFPETGQFISFQTLQCLQFIIAFILNRTLNVAYSVITTALSNQGISYSCNACRRRKQTNPKTKKIYTASETWKENKLFIEKSLILLLKETLGSCSLPRK